TFLFLRYGWRFLLPILIVPSFAWMTSADPAPSNELEITFLDVGQGDCIHIAYPDGSHGLIDTGPRVYTGDPDFVARRVVSRYLWQRRIQKLAHVVISHPEDDHRGGYEFLSRAFPIDRLYFYRSQPDYAEPAIQLRSNSSFIHGRVSHQVLHPPAESSIWRDNNDSSVVLLLTFGHFSALLGGDVSKRVEEGLPSLENTVTLLKVGHHGSRTSTSERFLQRLGPKLAVISAGRRNRFGHPANEVMERLKRFTRAVYSTQTSGTIRVRTDGHQVRVEGYRQAGGFETVEEFSVRTP
ncbi:MAG: MBL fold metallo-hydrolase, partial [Acidobacteriota bacterium]